MKNPKKILIKSNAKRILVVQPLVNGRASATVVIKPGTQEVAVKVWEAIAIQLRDKVSLGILEEVKANVVPKKAVVKLPADASPEEKKLADSKAPIVGYTVEDAKSFAELNPTDANNLIKETFDLDLLKIWKETDKRDEIRVAASVQYDLVETGKSKPKTPKVGI